MIVAETQFPVTTLKRQMKFGRVSKNLTATKSHEKHSWPFEGRPTCPPANGTGESRSPADVGGSFCEEHRQRAAPLGDVGAPLVGTQDEAAPLGVLLTPRGLSEDRVVVDLQSRVGSGDRRVSGL